MSWWSRVSRSVGCAPHEIAIVAARPLVAQGRDTVLLIGVAAWHEPTATEAGDGLDSGDGKASSVQPHRRDAGTGGFVAFVPFVYLEGSDGI